MIVEILRDLRYGRRMLAKSPGFTAMIVLTLALGIGANTAVFSLVNGVILRPLPYKDPARLVDVFDASKSEKGFSQLFDSYRDFEEYSRYARTLDRISVATWAWSGAILTGRGPAHNVLSIVVSEGFFSLLGMEPVHGRTFTHDDMRGGCSVVLSDGFWRETLAAEPDIVGKPLTLNQRPCLVLGVMPPQFAFYPQPAKLWMLLTPDFTPPPDKLPVLVLARLKPGFTLAQAQDELTALHAAAHPGDLPERDLTPVVNPLQDEFTFLAGRNLRTTLWVLLAAVALVLLIACSNVANLLLARSFARDREFAVRAALGSGRGRLVRQLLVEGLLPALPGGALGVGIAWGVVRYFTATNPVELPVGADISISLPVLIFTTVLSVATAMLFGLAPAWRASRTNLNQSLHSAGRGLVAGGHRLARTLAGAEIALSLTLLAGAGLLIESVFNMASEPLGFDPGHITTISTTVAPNLQDHLHRDLNLMPGVAGAALATVIPPFGVGLGTFHVHGRTEAANPTHDVGESAISADYFDVLGIPLLKGRAFDARDRKESEPVTIVSQSLVHKYFPDSDPIGERIRVGDRPEDLWLTIVGVAGTVKGVTVLEEMKWVDGLTAYRPLAQNPQNRITIVARAKGDPAAIGRAIQQAIAATDGNAPVNEPETMRDRLGAYLTYPRFRAIVLGAFAGLALLLAAIGLYGVLAQFVTQRTPEIGVRMAMGAQARDVLYLVAKQGARPVIAGLIAGLVGAVALTRYVSSLLYGVRPADPITLSGVSLVMLACAAAAIAIPARRATRVDPMVALRNE